MHQEAFENIPTHITPSGEEESLILQKGGDVSRSISELDEFERMNVYGALHIPHLKDAINHIEGPEVNIVIHPLYEMSFVSPKAFRKDIWDNTKNDPRIQEGKNRGEIYCEQYLVDALNAVLQNTPEGKYNPAYFRVVEMYEDFKALKNLGNQNNTPTIFVLPRAQRGTAEGDLPSLEVYEPLVSIMNTLQSEQLFYIESAEWSSGHIDPTALSQLNEKLPPDVRVRLSGGYIGQCMTNFVDDFQSIQNGRTVYGDISDSTPVLDYWNTPMDPRELGLPAFKLPPTKTIATFAELEMLLQSNVEYQRYYRDHLQKILDTQKKFSGGIPWYE